MKRLFPFVLAACVMGAAQGASEEPKGRIAGSVRSATTGEPLRSALISLHRSYSSQGFSRTTTSGPQGDFVFSGLLAGRYRLTVRKSGYRTLRGNAARLTLGDKQQVSNVVFQLWPQGAISGRVLDSEEEPVPEAQVRAYVLLHQETGVQLLLAGKAKSNDLGEYRIYGLPAGKYLAEVWPPREGTPAGEYYAATAAAFYPNAPAPAQALPVKVRWGRELSGIDLELSQSVTYSVAGTVGDATRGGPCFGCVVSAVRIDSGFLVSLPHTARVSSNGFFTLRGLSPGDYKIIARRTAADEVSQRLVTLTDGNLEDVGLVAGRAQPVSGEIILEDPPEGVEASKWTAYASSTVLPESWPDAKGRIGEDLRFRMESVSAESYRFEVLDLPPGAYLKALRVGGQRLPRPELTVPEDFPLTGVQAVIAFDAATVTGKVRPRRSGGGSEGPIEARVALIPKANRGGYVTAKAVETTPDGSFSFASVVPGAYTLYAMPAMSAAQVMDPSVQSALRTYARAVALEPGGTITVELPLAPDPEGTY